MTPSTAEPRAWRVRLQPRNQLRQRPEQEPDPGHAALAVREVALFAGVREPLNLETLAEPLDIEAALGADGADDGALVVAYVPGGATAGDLEKRAEAAAFARSPHRPPVRAGIRTVRVIWTPTHAFVFAPPDGFAEAIDAVLRFTAAARLALALEADMPATWAAIERDVPLTGPLRAAQLRQQPQVHAATERIVRANASRIRLQSALEQLDPGLAAASKRLFSELVEQSALHARLDALQDPLEFAAAHYELVNTRLIEARGMRAGHILELLIVVALALEVLLLALPQVARDPVANAPAAKPTAQGPAPGKAP